VIHRAQSRLGERKYNLLFNNCEHFATWCKTGVSYSKQVRKFIPTLEKLKVQSLYEPIHQAIKNSEKEEAQKLLNQALGDIKKVWEEIQPQYRQYREDAQTWEKVALKALQNQREDLAREAIKRKLIAQENAQKLAEKLQQLGTMTEVLLRNKG
jgi:phage shock protein A